ncbi:putative toxin-antitoxin system toxin component, PIN family [Pedobacter sp.]
MAGKTTRVILDTNLWISFLITKDFSRLDEIVFSKKCVIIFSEELLDEFIEVTKRPKLRRFFSPSDVEDIIEVLQEYAEFVTVKSNIRECRDEKDNFLLALAADGKADYLLTGDKDLLEIKKFRKTTISTISDFLDTK